MARRGRPTVEIKLSGNERKTLERWARRHSSAQSLALRCRVVLACDEGRTNEDIAAELMIHPEPAPSHWFCSGFRIECRPPPLRRCPSGASDSPPIVSTGWSTHPARVSGAPSAMVPDGHRANHRGGLAECLRKKRVGELRLSKPGR